MTIIIGLWRVYFLQAETSHSNRIEICSIEHIISGAKHPLMDDRGFKVLRESLTGEEFLSSLEMIRDSESH